VKRKSEAAAASTAAAAAALDDSRPLTLDEQELLTETINDLPPEHLGGVIQIIREAAPVGADEDEIDLEIDQLDTKTQRKLLRHVLKVRQAPPLFVVVSRFRFPV
jgi:Bromodomain extra-terminal - transcription regulation